MTLKSVYKATRGDAKRLAKDVQPGDILYVIHDIADRYTLGKGGLEDAQLYSIHIVTADRAWPSGHLTVCLPESRTGKGGESVVQLLAREREVLTEKPAGMRYSGDNRAGLNAQQFAAHIARQQTKKDDRQPVGAGAGKKSGWF
jgi:hypothetical protein